MSSIPSLLALAAILVVTCDAHFRFYSYNDKPYVRENCKIKSYGLTTIEQVQKAIDTAQEGQIIRLDPIVYVGNLVLKRINRKYITLLGDNQCNKNTVLRGQVSIRGSNWIVNAIVFEKTKRAIDVKSCSGVRLTNLVVNKIEGNAIEVENSEEVLINNLVVNEVANNAITVSYASDIQVNNGVISNVGGVAMKFDNCGIVNLRNNVFRNVMRETIRTIETSKVRIEQTVITGDSKKGEGWMFLEGDSYKVANTVATGAPKNGIVVQGCNYQFMANICTINNRNGYCIYLKNKTWNCRQNIGRSNLNIGGRGLYNA